jgi:hypothetical protein
MANAGAELLRRSSGDQQKQKTHCRWASSLRRQCLGIPDEGKSKASARAEAWKHCKAEPMAGLLSVPVMMPVVPMVPIPARSSIARIRIAAAVVLAVRIRKLGGALAGIFNDWWRCEHWRSGHEDGGNCTQR